MRIAILTCCEVMHTSQSETYTLQHETKTLNIELHSYKKEQNINFVTIISMKNILMEIKISDFVGSLLLHRAGRV